MSTRTTLLACAASAVFVLSSLLTPAMVTAGSEEDHLGHGHDPLEPTLLVSGLEGTVNGTIGPDGALYVPQGAIGEVTRIDTQTGDTSPYATGLPGAPHPDGGAVDVAFRGKTAYVLVSAVGDDVPGSTGEEVSGIYRIDDTDEHTLIADLGSWSSENPPDAEIFLDGGVQYALQPIRGDAFLVTDGHHNRVLEVSLAGAVEEVVQLGNVVPTGITSRGPVVFLAEAGPVPHEPSTGKVVAFRLGDPRPRDVAAGYSLIVDVAFGGCGLYALSQGDAPGDVPGTPGLRDSGELLAVAGDGTFDVIAAGLGSPTSLSFRGDTAFVVALTGEVWRFDGVPGAGATRGADGC